MDHPVNVIALWRQNGTIRWRNAGDLLQKGKCLHRPAKHFEAKAEKREAGDSYVTECSQFAAIKRSHLQIIAEAPRFPRLRTLFFSTVTKPGLAIITALLQEAREQQIIADLDFDAVAHTLLGGLLTFVLTSLVLEGEEAQPPALDRADAVVEVSCAH